MSQAKIPKALHEHINTAFPANVCLVGTVLPSGFAQIRISPRKIAICKIPKLVMVLPQNFSGRRSA